MGNWISKHFHKCNFKIINVKIPTTLTSWELKLLIAHYMYMYLIRVNKILHDYTDITCMLYSNWPRLFSNGFQFQFFLSCWIIQAKLFIADLNVVGFSLLASHAISFLLQHTVLYCSLTSLLQWPYWSKDPVNQKWMRVPHLACPPYT